MKKKNIVQMVPQRQSQCLFINYSISVKVGDIKADVIYQVTLSKDNDGKICVDFELVDYENVSIMGLPIKGDRASFVSFTNNYNNMGIDIQSLIDEEADKYISEEWVLEQNKAIIALL